MAGIIAAEGNNGAGIAGVMSDEAMFRRYNRADARFDQPDPYGGSYNLADPQSLNRYAYVQNDPVNFTDPSGLWVERCFETGGPEGALCEACRLGAYRPVHRTSDARRDIRAHLAVRERWCGLSGALCRLDGAFHLSHRGSDNFIFHSMPP